MKARSEVAAHALRVTVAVASLTLAGLAFFGGPLAAQDPVPVRRDTTGPSAVGAPRGTATTAGPARDTAIRRRAVPAYDNALKQNQLTLAGDVLWFF